MLFRSAHKLGFSNLASAATGIGTGVLTILVLIFGEIVPKSLATMNSERLSLVYAKPVYALTTVLTPLSYIMNGISNSILRILPIDISKRPKIT